MMAPSCESRRVHESDWRGGAYLASPRLPVYVGAFLAGVYRPYTRIDYTQHCLSAMIKLERYELE